MCETYGWTKVAASKQTDSVINGWPFCTNVGADTTKHPELHAPFWFLKQSCNLSSHLPLWNPTEEKHHAPPAGRRSSSNVWIAVVQCKPEGLRPSLMWPFPIQPKLTRGHVTIAHPTQFCRYTLLLPPFPSSPSFPSPLPFIITNISSTLCTYILCPAFYSPCPFPTLSTALSSSSGRTRGVDQSSNGGLRKNRGIFPSHQGSLADRKLIRDLSQTL